MSSLPRILIVDDEFIIRETLENLFSAQDVQLLFAESGQQGLDMAQQYLPDAILLDVMMPGMDGYETCRRIRSNPALAEVHVIMITALDDRNSRLTGLLAGADDFLTKPFDGLEVQIRVRNILRINRYRNLIEERSRFYWVVEHAEKGYLLLDAQGGIQYANQSAQVFLHLPQIYTDICFDEQMARYYQPHVQGDDPVHGLDKRAGYYVQPETSTARPFWLRVDALTPFGSEDQQLLCLNDVTTEMSVHQDIRKMHLLVSHKLRTPVSHMYGAMSILEMQMDNLPGDDWRPPLKTAWEGAERLVQEVQEILKYIDAPLTLTAGDPVTLDEVCSITMSVASSLGVETPVISRSSALENLTLGITAAAMELVIFEILENARKFHISHNPHVELQISADMPQLLQLRFCDDGPGMTAAQIACAMLPYVQGEKWFTGELPGLGLGIPLAASLVWQSNGKFRIVNRQGDAGVCVTVELPVLLSETPVGSNSAPVQQL